MREFAGTFHAGRTGTEPPRLAVGAGHGAYLFSARSIQAVFS